MDSTETIDNQAVQNDSESRGAAPGLLIASSDLRDPNFAQSVVLMIEHNDDGAVGIVINQLTDASIQELCADQEIASTCAKPIRLGGPIAQERIWVIHDPAATETASFTLTDNISISVTREALQALAGSQQQARGDAFMVCAGYAGWGPGQLEEEIESGAWIPFPVDGIDIFRQDAKSMWGDLLLSLGIFQAAPASSDTIN